MAFPALTRIIEPFHNDFDLLTATEIGCALLIPLLAILLKTRIERHIKTRAQDSYGMAFFTFATPLIAPLLAALLGLLALATYRAYDLESGVLLLVVKLYLAWLAIKLVFLLSSQQIAGWFVALVILPVTVLHLFGLWEPTIAALTDIRFTIGSVQLNAFLLFKGIAIVVILQWIAGLLVQGVDRRLSRVESMRASNRALVLKMFQIVLYCLIIVMGMQMLGINMSVLGVFGGAIGVGIGFGLQKIASNFISGIILLFEKSIEIGDLVEFNDGTSGYVRQTYARYTRLEMSDGKELMIPNEEFITQRVNSWTHTDTRARIEIRLQVAYDTDMDFARMLMIEAAKAHPACMPERDVSCYLTNFADSGVQLVLYFWVANVREGRVKPKSDVMLSILRAFNEQGVQIPYPQVLQHTPPAHMSYAATGAEQPKPKKKPAAKPAATKRGGA